jgi:zinc transport system substrate-binding protein
MLKFLDMKKALILILCLFSACDFMKNTSEKNTKPLIIVSAAPYEMVVRQLAGETVDIRGIIPPDVDPHNYEPSPRDMGPFAHAAVWIQVGEEFEYLLENRLKETTPNLRIINLPEITKTLKSSCGHKHHGHCDNSVDTHYWMDPITVIDQAGAIKKSLVQILPENKALFQRNFEALKAKLTLLNKKLTTELAPYSGNVYLTTHKAYGYFCHRYHLLQIGIEADDGKEMRSKDIHQVLEESRSHKNELIGILTQPQHVNRAAETIGIELDLPLFMVNPYEEDYIATIEKLAEITVEHGKNPQ